MTMGKSEPAIVRFEAKFVVHESGCWLWTAATRGGYGTFWDGARLINAHRWSYGHFVGPITPGLHLDHLCRVRCCVNPAHLEPVTPQINTLRGEGVTAVNARKTHCIHGHEFTPENTYVYPHKTGTGRGCRTCRHTRRTQQGTTNRKAVA